MAHYPRPLTDDEVMVWITRSLERYERDGFGLLAMVMLDSGHLIGDCGPTLQEVEGVHETELGWHVRRDLWGRGLATEAASATRDWAFEQLRRPRLVALVRPDNVASARVAQKVGMRLEREVAFAGLPHQLFAMPAPWADAADHA